MKKVMTIFVKWRPFSLDAILNFSKCSRVTKVHHPADSENRPPGLPKTVKKKTYTDISQFSENMPLGSRTITQPNGLQAIGILYLWRTRVMYGLRNSELSTSLFQFSHKTRQTMLLYGYFTPKDEFKRKFNHHQSFLYEWRL